MAKNLMSSVFGGQGSKAAESPEASATDAGAEQASAAAEAQSTASRLPVIVLGKTLTFKGELYADEDLMLFGRVEGRIQHSAALTVAVGGVVIGDIHAKVMTIKGTVEGDLEATESITLSPSADVQGDIKAPRVCIIEGAQFNGAVEMTEAPAAEPTPSTSDSGAPLSEKHVDKVLGGT